MTDLDTSEAAPSKPKSRRGFAGMSPEKHRHLASLGGKACHEQGRAHEFTPEEAREAGRIGGNSVAKDRDHMAAIGRAGGLQRGRNYPKPATGGSR